MWRNWSLRALLPENAKFFRKMERQSLDKHKTELPCDPAVPFLSICPKQLTSCSGHFAHSYTRQYCLQSLNVESNMPWQTRKCSYPCNEILFNCKAEGEVTYAAVWTNHASSMFKVLYHQRTNAYTRPNHLEYKREQFLPAALEWRVGGRYFLLNEHEVSDLCDGQS